jgi:hypothetical protein
MRPLKNKSKRQIIAAILFVLWFITIIIAFFFINTETVSYTTPAYTKTFESPSNPSIPSINAKIVTTFTAKGSISAENPLIVKVTVSGVNTSDLLQYYGAVGYSGSTYTDSKAHYSLTGDLTSGAIPLSKESNGIYVGTETLIWHSEADTYITLIPQPQYSYHINFGLGIDSPITHISSISDTYNWKFDEATTKFNIIVLAFSFLLLQPIFDALCHLKNDD